MELQPYRSLQELPIPIGWFLKYIKDCEEQDTFFSSYGTFMHKLIEEYYKGIISKEDMPVKFLKDFSKEVRGARPKRNVVQKYINSGLKYLKGFSPFPFNMIDVEKQVDFKIEDNSFIGYIDYLGEENGEYIIVDNKSRELKPRSGRKTPTNKDKELDDMLRQLYLYSAAVKQEYGKFPKYLCFNCFKSGVFIKETFSEASYNATVKWATEQIEKIKNTESFLNRPRLCRQHKKPPVGNN